VQTTNQSQGKSSNTTGHAPSKHPTHLNNPKAVTRTSDNEQGPVQQRLPPKEKDRVPSVYHQARIVI